MQKKISSVDKRIRSELTRIVEKLKKHREEFHDLSPLGLAEFLKIKSSLLEKNIYITDEMLDLPTEQIVDLLVKQIRSSYLAEVSLDKDYEILDFLTEVESPRVDLLEEERIRLRKAVMSQDTILKLVQSGKQFSVSLSANMRVCKVIVPSSWQIDMPQSLLLALYDREFGLRPSYRLEVLTDFVLFLTQYFTDLASVIEIVSVYLRSKCDVTRGISDVLLLYITERNALSSPVYVSLAVLSDAVEEGRISKEDVLTKIGKDSAHRKRWRYIFYDMLYLLKESRR